MAISRSWELSKLNYYFDFVTVPVAIAISVYLSGFNLWLFVSGVLAWSLIEYLTHRYLFHVMFRHDHWLHHMRESDYVGVTTLKTTAILAIIFTLFTLVGIAPIYQGIAFGYLLYIVTHDAIHHPNFLTNLIPGIKATHIVHHRLGDEINFGVTSSLWDRLLGTYHD